MLVNGKQQFLCGQLPKYRLGTSGTQLRGFRPEREVTDDVIVTEAEPRLLLHHP